MSARTFELADRTIARILVKRNVRGSLLTAYWYPPKRYTVAELFIGRDGAVQLNLGRLHLGRYRRTAR